MCLQSTVLRELIFVYFVAPRDLIYERIPANLRPAVEARMYPPKAEVGWMRDVVTHILLLKSCIHSPDKATSIRQPKTD